MKFRQMLKKQKRQAQAHIEKKKFLLLNEALKKLVELNIATIINERYKYSPSFEHFVQDIVSSPPNKLTQIKLAQQAGHKLIPEILAIATTKTSRRDIENMIVAYVCLKIFIKEKQLTVDNKFLPDLTHAVWYLNDNEPTIEEVETWTSQA